MTTSAEFRILTVLTDDGITCPELAAKLWPHWTTQRGAMTAASTGKARQMLRRLEVAGTVKKSDKTRGGWTVFIRAQEQADDALASTP
jgi:hypothetical protein